MQTRKKSDMAAQVLFWTVLGGGACFLGYNHWLAPEQGVTTVQKQQIVEPRGRPSEVFNVDLDEIAADNASQISYYAKDTDVANDRDNSERRVFGPKFFWRYVADPNPRVNATIFKKIKGEEPRDASGTAGVWYTFQLDMRKDVVLEAVTFSYGGIDYSGNITDTTERPDGTVLGYVDIKLPEGVKVFEAHIPYKNGEKDLISNPIEGKMRQPVESKLRKPKHPRGHQHAGNDPYDRGHGFRFDGKESFGNGNLKSARTPHQYRRRG